MASLGLQRLAQLAKDEHSQDPKKTVQQVSTLILPTSMASATNAGIVLQ